ncbi:type I phosphomannose isomerase catalytic subunit [Tenacibaculum sp. SG-28]|uniref:type I phosphomannose isomerase catalytic subunit n=1 Tax=Tenacibaculum sp. SG-28 TaxID=754426 RepID=UPI000CF45673|nr:type I phosphomannose isomerase catalytic subunit [Tenacibaculum sp. SG-28]PQJ23069.1 mannose-6-phosphate isomerase [Tenacibaculum sp. SG-28]
MQLNQTFFKFTPILQEKIWGGTKLATLLGKKSNNPKIGESWEISDVDGFSSVVCNGRYIGWTLKELLKKHKEHLVGVTVYEKFKDTFPLLIKFIDANQDLSIQLHPDDSIAKSRHNSFGKAEMWYIMQAEENSKLIVGFANDSSKEEYLKHLKNNTLTAILNQDIVQEGDVYFIPSGRVHAICKGVLIAEIQQTSDITYRIYDWGRKDSTGKPRELHTEQAFDAIDFTSEENYKSAYETKMNAVSPVISSSYFTTNIICVKGKVLLEKPTLDSFKIYMCVSGKVTFMHGDEEETLQQGETLLVPYICKNYAIKASETSKILEVYIV